MSFEIFTRKIQRGGGPALTITTNGRISFNKSATAKFEENAVENVLLMWDEDRRLIGVRPITKKDHRAYKLHYGKKSNGCGFSASTFLKHIGYDESETQSMPNRWDEQEGMFITEVSEQYLKKDKQQLPLSTPAANEGVRKVRLRRLTPEESKNLK